MSGIARGTGSLIRLHGVTRRYGRLLALDCPQVDLPPGAVGLLGPNGAGKSTLLKILLGLLPPSSGRAELLGLDVRRHGRTIRGRVGYLSENAAIAPGLKALELVALAGELAGLPRRDALRRAHEVLTYLGVEGARYRGVEEQSTGMRQRIQLAQALVHDPDLLVLDEPTNGLDPAGRKAMLSLIQSLHREFSKSVILSSHLLEDVDRICDSLLILKDGKVVAHGRTADLRLELRERYRLKLRGDVRPCLSKLAAEGVGVIGSPRQSFDEWEGLIEVPPSWPKRRFFEILGAEPGESGAVLRALVPERERLSELFERITAGEAHVD
jgi:ABC-2 type transport system ATP-binding protein